ncbi:MAG TPA: class I SAM-dependent methyltransferase [Pseudonocardiaceae bacterium]|jgi:SAM-dependent methyltransferase
MDTRSQQARSFGRQASSYERLRPTYPVAAIEDFLPEPGKRVVDVGAGTGKLTGVLIGAGHAVVAVEPDPDMRATLVEALPGIDAREGTGEALPVEDHSADAICYGQSWHWVEQEAASREARRVLTGDGVLALIWNMPDAQYPWVRRLHEITRPGEDTRTDPVPMPLSGFAPGKLTRTRWRQRLSPDELVQLVGTYSRIAVSPPEQRDATLDAVRELLATHPDVAGRDEIEMPYVCLVLSYRPV